MGMRKLGGQPPLKELAVSILGIGRNQFDSGLETSLALREEYGAVIRTSEILLQRKLVVNDLAFPLFPSLGLVGYAGGLACFSAVVWNLRRAGGRSLVGPTTGGAGHGAILAV